MDDSKHFFSPWTAQTSQILDYEILYILDDEGLCHLVVVKAFCFHPCVFCPYIHYIVIHYQTQTQAKMVYQQMAGAEFVG